MNPAEWKEIVSALDTADVPTCVEAAARFRAESGVEDVPNLLGLLGSSVREAAAWPLAELAGPCVPSALFAAYQRGFDEGHDNFNRTVDRGFAPGRATRLTCILWAP